MQQNRCIVPYRLKGQIKEKDKKRRAVTRRWVRQILPLLSFAMIVFFPVAIMGGLEAGQIRELPAVTGCLVCMASGVAIARHSGIMP